MTIYAGDTPTIKFTLRNSLGLVDLSAGTLKIVMKNNASRVEKTNITITDALNGKCELPIAKTDLQPGTCTLQPIISYSDGREFTFGPTTFNVESRI